LSDFSAPLRTLEEISGDFVGISFLMQNFQILTELHNCATSPSMCKLS
jgi:hypothetical protein